MDARTARTLCSPEGQRALEVARATRGEPEGRRRTAVEARVGAEDARAVLAQDDLRVRAAVKTPLAEALLFTREALEQATPAPVAEERAARFHAFPRVADLCAGVGLDTIALARAGRHVVAVERDPARAALLAHNARAAGVDARVEVVVGDVATAQVECDAAFLDPDRRAGGERTRDPDRFEPPAATWAALAARFGHLLVKLPPALPSPPSDAGVELVSLDGRLREARTGFGALAISAARRALVLPSGASLDGAGCPWPDARAPRPGDVLLDPDPAVVVAGLVGEAAIAAGAAPVHPRIAYLLGDRAMPWARCDRVEAVLPADPRALRAELAARDVGDLELRQRGIADPPEAWRRRLRPRGGARATLVLTRGPDDRYVALLVRRF
ncbi:MAG TPA: SAM-dependent methyltransferase [Planctomycetota bacterium]|nr:SAM-dependent methyltransferase [Planctomycetota bacterium]